MQLMCGALGGWMIAMAMYAAKTDKIGVVFLFVGFALFMLLLPHFFKEDDGK